MDDKDDGSSNASNSGASDTLLKNSVVLMENLSNCRDPRPESGHLPTALCRLGSCVELISAEKKMIE